MSAAHDDVFVPTPRPRSRARASCSTAGRSSSRSRRCCRSTSCTRPSPPARRRLRPRAHPGEGPSRDLVRDATWTTSGEWWTLIVSGAAQDREVDPSPERRRPCGACVPSALAGAPEDALPTTAARSVLAVSAWLERMPTQLSGARGRANPTIHAEVEPAVIVGLARNGRLRDLGSPWGRRAGRRGRCARGGGRSRRGGERGHDRRRDPGGGRRRVDGGRLRRGCALPASDQGDHRAHDG